MASIRKIKGKRGDSYKIVVSLGYGEDGKQRRHCMTWKPPDGINARQVKKEVAKAAAMFENKINLGFRPDTRATFEEFAKAHYIRMLEYRETAPQSIDKMKSALDVICGYIGRMKLVDIRPAHITTMYQELSKPGNNKGKQYAIPGEYFNNQPDSMTQLAKRCGVSIDVIRRCIRRQNVRIESAAKIEKALKRNDLFEYSGENAKISPYTIVMYHTIVRGVLNAAEKEMIVTYNAADRATLPKRRRVNPATPLSAENVAEVLQALDSEPYWFRVIIHLFLVTGCRRGELLALTWSKINFATKEAIIDESLNYTTSIGVYTGSTKTGTTRVVSLPDETIELLKQYRLYQLERGISSDEGYLFTVKDGKPLQPTTVNCRLNKFTERHNLRHIRPHELRHTFASLMIAAGTDVVTVASMLGHVNAETTIKTYAHAVEDNKRKAAETIANTILYQEKKIM